MIKNLIILTILNCVAYAAIKVIYQGLQDDNFTKQDLVNDWIIDNIPKFLQGTNPWTSDCGTQKGRRLFGGYNIFKGIYDEDKRYKIRKVINDLPPHYSVRFQAKIFKIDSWNHPKDILTVTMNNEVIFSSEWDCCFDNVDMCGSKIPPTDKTYNYAYNEGIKILNEIRPHTSSNWNIVFYSTHDDNENESWGFREVTVSIDTCHYTCSSCSGPTKNQCTRCFANAKLLPDGRCQCLTSTQYQSEEFPCTLPTCTTCQNSCKFGYYKFQSDVNECQLCSEECIGCENSSTNCLNCIGGYYLSQVSPTEKQCIQCPLGCLTCQKNSINVLECLSCSGGFYIFNNYCLKCDDKCGKCVTAQDNCTECNKKNGYYLNASICQKCNPDCEQCNDSLGCSFCKMGLFKDPTGVCVQRCPSSYNGNSYYGDILDRVCKLNCPDGYYGFWETNRCEKCHPDCTKCTRGDNKACLECLPSLYLDGRSCVEKCPLTKFTDEINKQCNYFIPAPNKPSCKIACQDGKQYDPASFTCVACAPTCALCFGKLPSNCLECDGNLYLNSKSECTTSCVAPTPYKDDSTNKCVAQCPVGYYVNNGHCVSCNHTCRTCSSSSTCDSCNEDLGWNATVSSSGLCTCPKGTYDDGSSKDCKKCPAKQDLTLTQCVQCPIDPITFLCTCSSNQYQDPLYPTICIPCNGDCLTCNNSPDQCLTCNESQNRQYNPVKKTCDCLEGMFYNKSNDPSGSFICQYCNSNCKTCNNTKETCTSCKIEDFRELVNNQCVCMKGYYENNGICLKCNSNCDLCTSFNQCIECTKPYYLNINKLCVSECLTSDRLVSPDEKYCIDTCPIGSYPNANNKCEKCDKACISCISSPTDCDQCNQGSFQSGNTCVSSCPDGQYINLKDKKCETCPNHCSKCTSSLNCTQCDSQSELINKLCFEFCQAGQYRSITSLNCEKCMDGCLLCSQFQSCQKCDEKNYINQNGVCVLGCDFEHGYYFDNMTQSCKQCHFSCNKCYDSSVNCIECQENMVFNKQIGICECIQGYQWNEVARECQVCDKVCPKCEYQNFKLVNCSCPEGYYQDNITSCKPCVNQICKTCNVSQPNECLSCYGDLELVSGDCTVNEEEKKILQLDDSHNFILIFLSIAIGFIFVVVTTYYFKKKKQLKQEKQIPINPQKSQSRNKVENKGIEQQPEYQQVANLSVIQSKEYLQIKNEN